RRSRFTSMTSRLERRREPSSFTSSVGISRKIPRRISYPSALTAMVSTTSTAPSVRSVTSVENEVIASSAKAGEANSSARTRSSAAMIRSAADVTGWVSELHRWHGPLGLVLQLEILGLFEAEGVGDDVLREAL